MVVLLLLLAVIQTPNISAEIREFSKTNSNWATCTNTGSGVHCHRFVREVVRAANPTCDPKGWGLLTKEAGQQQCTLNECGALDGSGYGEDAIIYGATNQVVDIISSVGTVGAQIQWLTVARRPGNNWACLMDGPAPPITPPSPPNPSPTPDPDITELRNLIKVMQGEIKQLASEVDSLRLEVSTANNELSDLRGFVHERFGLNETWIQELQARPTFKGCTSSILGIRGSCNLIP